MTEPVKCVACGRERKPSDFDYSPIQVITNAELGWYSGDDGEICPEDMTKTIRGQ